MPGSQFVAATPPPWESVYSDRIPEEDRVCPTEDMSMPVVVVVPVVVEVEVVLPADEDCMCSTTPKRNEYTNETHRG